jgi:hypothetical protein
VIRADILNHLTVDGQQALLDYGVRTVIDLRSPQEVEKEPSSLPSEPAAGKILSARQRLNQPGKDAR